MAMAFCSKLWGKENDETWNKRHDFELRLLSTRRTNAYVHHTPGNCNPMLKLRCNESGHSNILT